MAHLPIALQLYTVRDETAKDFIGTLKRVAEIGYEGVEFAGFGGLSAHELCTVLADLQLTAAAAHIGFDELRETPGAVIDYQLEIGNPYVVIPWMAGHNDLAGWEEEAAMLNKLGALLKENNLQLCYHNHAHEFEMVDGERGLDVLYRLTDPALLKTEPDLYWVQKGGEDPVKYVRKYAGREPLLHIKDMAADAEGSFTEFGAGILPWKEIFAAAEKGGVQWYIVEQYICAAPAWKALPSAFAMHGRPGELRLAGPHPYPSPAAAREGETVNRNRI